MFTNNRGAQISMKKRDERSRIEPANRCAPGNCDDSAAAQIPGAARAARAVKGQT